MRSRLALALLPALLLLGACMSEAPSEDIGARTAAVTTTNGTAQVTITPHENRMAFWETRFTVAPGQEVTLVFENTATRRAMIHNVVLLRTEEQAVVNRVGQAALAAGKDAAYLPDDEAIVAATELASPGETVAVTFTAPSEPGAYAYLCTFPGHYLTMQGTMHVEAAPAT